MRGGGRDGVNGIGGTLLVVDILVYVCDPCVKLGAGDGRHGAVGVDEQVH